MYPDIFKNMFGIRMIDSIIVQEAFIAAVYRAFAEVMLNYLIEHIERLHRPVLVMLNDEEEPDNDWSYQRYYVQQNQRRLSLCKKILCKTSFDTKNIFAPSEIIFFKIK